MRSGLISLLIAICAFFWCMQSLSGQNFIISGGNSFTTALDAYGNVWTWGDNTGGQLGRGSVGTYYTEPGVVNMQGVAIQSIDAGSASHVVALDCHGGVWTWGDNSYGQLGNPAVSAMSVSPVRVKGVDGNGNLDNAIYVTSSTSATYAILDDNRLVAWGGNEWGELGDGTSNSSPTPVYVTQQDGTQLQNIVAVDAGDQHCYALDANGYVWAWGGNQWNTNMNCVELGVGEGFYAKVTRARRVIKSTTQTDYLTNIKMITAGDTHGLFYDNQGRVWSVGGDWGPGQRGNTTGYDWEFYAKQVAAGEQQSRSGGDQTGLTYLAGVRQIAAGMKHSIALVDTDGDGYGRVMVWGGDWIQAYGAYETGGDGVLGRGAASYTNDESASGGTELPIYVESTPGVILENAINVSDGDGVTYIETVDPATKEHKIVVFGNNNRGQLGVGHANRVYYPVEPNLNYHLVQQCPDANLSASFASVCDNQQFDLDAQTDGPHYHYIWTKDGSPLHAFDTSGLKSAWTFDPQWDTPVVTVVGGGTYGVTVVDLASAKACKADPCPNASDALTIGPIPAPEVHPDLAVTICPQQSGLIETTVLGDFYNWYSSASGGSAFHQGNSLLYLITTDTVLYLESQASNGCVSSSRAAVTISNGQAPVAAFTVADTVLFQTQTAQFINQSQHATSYLWNFGDGLGVSMETDPGYAYVNTGAKTIKLTAVSSDQCKDSVTHQVSIASLAPLFIPTAFTPNGDAENDAFFPRGMIHTKEMIIYNQWGLKVYTSDQANASWNGQYKGKEAPEGNYVYFIAVETYAGHREQYHGLVTLIR